MIEVTENIILQTTKAADKFFMTHKNVYEKFIENIRSYYHCKNSNVDIKAMKGYKHLYRMRINNYRVVYKLENAQIKIISVIAVASRGQVYNDL